MCVFCTQWWLRVGCISFDAINGAPYIHNCSTLHCSSKEKTITVKYFTQAIHLALQQVLTCTEIRNQCFYSWKKAFNAKFQESGQHMLC